MLASKATRVLFYQIAEALLVAALLAVQIPQAHAAKKLTDTHA